MHFGGQLNCWSLRCSWSIACRRCPNYIFILDLTPCFNILHQDNCKPRRETYKFWDLVRLILEIYGMLFKMCQNALSGPCYCSAVLHVVFQYFWARVLSTPRVNTSLPADCTLLVGTHAVCPYIWPRLLRTFNLSCPLRAQHLCVCTAYNFCLWGQSCSTICPSIIHKWANM